MSLDHDRVALALPGYEIGDEVGRGAWGIVLRARHRQLGRDVAVKELPQAFAADPGVRHRFVTEARLLATLDHPHIVPIYDYVEGEGLCLLVMELLSGGTVWERFTSAGISADAACGIVLATCSALHHAHERGILHRDVKPDNLLFTAVGTLKVSDFGIAKVVGGAASMATRTGEVLGTPAYMAPEQALGRELTPATDVYAVATVLYEMLAGRLPFVDDGNAIGLLYRHVHEYPVPLTEAAPEVPDDVSAMVMRGLARDPDDRHHSAEDFGVALAEAAGGAWGAGWVQRGGVDVLASGRIRERISQPSPATLPDQPIGDAASERPAAVVTPLPASAPPTVVEPAAKDDNEGPRGALSISPEDLVPLSQIVADETPPVTPALIPTDDAMRARASRRRARRSTILVAGGVVGVLLIIGTAVALAVGGGGEEGSSSRSHPATGTPKAAATVNVGQQADHVAAGGEGIWVSDNPGNALVRIDPATDSVARVAVDGAPHSVAVTGDAVWATVNPGGLVKVEQAAGSATVIPVPVDVPLTEVAAGEGAVWATSGQAGLVRLDPTTNKVAATIAVGASPDSVVAGEGAVWVANRTTPGTVTRVDPKTNRVIATVPVGANPDQLATGAGSVWSANSGDGTISRIDPATNKVVATIPVGADAASLVVGENAVWVSHPGTGRVSKIDPRTNRVTATLHIGGRPESIAVGAGSVWVADTSGGAVVRITPG